MNLIIISYVISIPNLFVSQTCPGRGQKDFLSKINTYRINKNDNVRQPQQKVSFLVNLIPQVPVFVKEYYRNSKKQHENCYGVAIRVVLCNQ